MIADKRNKLAIGRELGIVAGAFPGIADLDARSVAQVVDPQTAVRVEEQVLRIRSPDIARHPIAVAMVAVLLRAFPPASEAILARLTRTCGFLEPGSRSINSPPSRYVRCCPSGDQASPARQACPLQRHEQRCLSTVSGFAFCCAGIGRRRSNNTAANPGRKRISGCFKRNPPDGPLDEHQ